MVFYKRQARPAKLFHADLYPLTHIHYQFSLTTLNNTECESDPSFRSF